MTEVDVPGKRVILADGEVPYDFLILSAGATHAYFGHDDWARFAPGLKSLNDAMEVRRRVFSAFEVAERETDEARRRAWMTFVVVGGGPTGVELSGALAELSRSTLAHEFRHIDPREARVVLVQGGPRNSSGIRRVAVRRRLQPVEVPRGRSPDGSARHGYRRGGRCDRSGSDRGPDGPLGGRSGCLSPGSIAGCSPGQGRAA